MIANAKHKRHFCRKALGAFLFFMAFAISVHGQVTTMPDSLTQGQPGGQQAPQSGAPGQAQQSQAPQQEGQVNFQATDSLVFNFREDRIATLYGSAKVIHESGELTAGKVALNLDKTLVSAATQTPQDTLSQPVLLRQNDRIRSESIAFNYETEKGRFDVARTSVSEGYLTGTKVKNTGPHVVFLEDAIYSTCDLDHPHYYIKAKRMKVVDEEKIFFTRAQLYILDIPYPIIFPFGYVPGKIDQKQSGLLQPTYVSQNQATRGLGVQNLGWFQYFNDYLVGQASVDIFTSGSFFLDASTRYSKRNKYNGNIQLGYSRERGLESTDPNFTINTQKRLSITHNQDFSPYANISANINLRTADFNRRNSFDIDERAEVSTSSSLSYRYRHPENLYNFSVSARQNQNFNTNVTRLSGPDANFSLKQFSPFSKDNTGGAQQPAWYENISIRYQNSFESEFDYDPIDADSAQVNWFEALLNPSQYREATGDDDHYKYGFRQQAGLNFGSLIPSRFINLSANANYTEYWFPTSIRKSFNADSNRVETDQVRGFEAARDFSTGLSMSTTIYGLVNKRIGNITGFRHTLRPSLSFSYSPDFSSDFWGYYREVQTDTTSNRVQKYSIFENEVFTGPGRGEQRALSLRISNVFEAKQVKRDSTGEKNERTLRLIDQLDMNTSYNFAADSLKLSDMSTSLSTNFIPGINLRANATFNFYQRDSLGTKFDRFLIEDSKQFAELTNFSLSASYSLNLDGGQRVNDKYYFPARYDPYDQSIFNEMDSNFNRQPVSRIDSPFSVSFSFRYSWRLNPTGENNKSATLNAQNIRFQLTPKWSFSTRLGYDFIDKDLTPSQFSLSRSLHMWNLNFQMNPFGDFQYYAFALRLNSSQIQSIFQKLPLLKNLERSSSPSGRRPAGF